jgi:DNA-binding transcriptional regulator YiaG
MHLALENQRPTIREVLAMDNEHREEGHSPTNGGTVVSEDDLGWVIRYLRQQLRMTQEELAQALGITVGTVSRWEKGRFRPSRLARALILKFAEAHNVPVSLRPARLS